MNDLATRPNILLILCDQLRGDAPPFRTAVMVENDDDFVPMKTRTLVTARWKLTHYTGQSYGELYDRIADPGGVPHLWDDPAHAAIRNELMAMLMEEVMCGLDVSNGRVQKPGPPQAIKWIPRHNHPSQGE